LPIVELILVLWTVVAIVLGYLVAREVRGLRELGATVVLAGRATDQTAVALDRFADLPFVGGDIRRVAVNARRTARSAVVNGRAARSHVDRLATLLWVAVAAAAIVPAFISYGVLRFGSRAP
jgi:hypothetical protein